MQSLFSLAFYFLLVAGWKGATPQDIPDNDPPPPPAVQHHHRSVLTTITELLDASRSADALYLLDKLSASEQADLPVQLAKGRALVQLGRVADGEQVLRDAVAAHPASLNASLLLGRLYVQTQRWDSVEAEAKRAVALSRGASGEALALLAKVCLVRDNDPQKARLHLEHAMQAEATPPARVMFDYGMLLFHFNHDDAKAALDAYVRVHPAAANRKYLAKVFMHYGHQAWARDTLQGHAAALDDSEAALLLAGCHDALGDVGQAAEGYAAVLDVEPHNAVAHGALGLLLLGCGSRNYAAEVACGLNQERALQHLRVALQLDGSSRLRAVEDAVLNCQREITEVKAWRSAVAVGRNRTAKPPTTTAAAAAANVPTASVMSDLLAAVAATKKLGRLLRAALRLLFLRMRLCESRAAEVGGEQDFAPPLRGLVRFICREQTHGAVSAAAAAAAAPALSAEEKAARMRQNWARREEQAGLPAVPRLAVASAADFVARLVHAHVPAVVTNFQEGWGVGGDADAGAGEDAFSKAALVRRFGDSIVRVSVSESGRFDGPESGALWGLPPSTDVLVRPPATSMLLHDFFALANATAAARATTAGPTFYLEYLALHQYLGEPFLALVPQPPPAAASVAAGALEPLVTNLWVGTQPTVSPLHYDDYENLLCQVKGRKEVVIFPPADIDHLYYVGRPKGTLRFEPPATFVRDLAAVDARAFVFGSSVHVDRPDLARHPLYALATPSRAVLGPGDCLFLPAFWHHEVQSLPDEHEGVNVAVNFWYRNTSFPTQHRYHN